MIESIKELLEYREFLLQYTLQQLRARYRGSVLGFFWTLLNPLLLCIAFSIIFSYINRADIRTFGVFFFSGYIPWMFFVATTTAGTSSIIGNAHYVSRVYLPNAIFPVSAALVNFVDFMAGMVVVIGVMVAAGAPLTPALAVLPLSILILLVFVQGLAFLFAVSNVFLRDFGLLWGTASFLWFFFTPILYPIETIPVGPRRYFEMNPALPFIRLFQDPISKGVLPPAETVLIASVLAVISAVIGFQVFIRSQRSFYLYL